MSARRARQRKMLNEVSWSFPGLELRLSSIDLIESRSKLRGPLIEGLLCVSPRRISIEIIGRRAVIRIDRRRLAVEVHANALDENAIVLVEVDRGIPPAHCAV